MRNWKSVVSALLFTVLLSGLGMLDGALLTGNMPEVGDAEISYAGAAKIPVIRLKKAIYDDDGNLTSCISGGSSCVVIVVAGRQVLFAGGEMLVN